MWETDVLKCRFHYYSGVVKPTDQGMTAIEKVARILTDLKRKGHATLWRATWKAQRSVTRQWECGENVGKSLHCGFHGKGLARQGKQA